MAPHNDDRNDVRPSVWRSGNPWRVEQAQYDLLAESKDLNAVKHEARPYVRHPYAFADAEAANSGELEVVVSTVMVPSSPQAVRDEMTMTEFDSEARRILIQHVPELERPRLTERYREFIARNRTRSGRGRRLIIDSLRKYDLSGVDETFNAKFNREEVSVTEEKLLEIEEFANKNE